MSGIFCFNKITINLNKNMKKHNFSAGPCILPQEVFQKSAEAILDFNFSL
jgi:phosphoserine aminotransferase